MIASLAVSSVSQTILIMCFCRTFVTAKLKRLWLGWHRSTSRPWIWNLLFEISTREVQWSRAIQIRLPCPGKPSSGFQWPHYVVALFQTQLNHQRHPRAACWSHSIQRTPGSRDFSATIRRAVTSDVEKTRYLLQLLLAFLHLLFHRYQVSLLILQNDLLLLSILCEVFDLQNRSLFQNDKGNKHV